MTDSALRLLEREFRRSGTVQDEAAWLRARVQAGLDPGHSRGYAHASQATPGVDLVPGLSARHAVLARPSLDHRPAGGGQLECR